jgi:hypothetical protein
MIFDMKAYTEIVRRLEIDIIYSGPLWEDRINGLFEMVKDQLSSDNLQGCATKSIFSVFVEQTTNMLLYSAEKKKHIYHGSELKDVAIGMLVLGHKKDTFFIQTRNAIKRESAEYLKAKIDHLNSLDKQSLRQYHKEKVKSENDNPDSKGAGLGLIEIARRASAPIEYLFETLDDDHTYFTMYVEIKQEEHK